MDEGFKKCKLKREYDLCVVDGGMFPFDEGPWNCAHRARNERSLRMAAKEGYCVKCKAKREIKEAKDIVMKNGRPATQGLCPECGTKIFKIGK